MDNIKYHTGSGERVLFWKDRWVGDRTLAAQFPYLFNCTVYKEAKVKDYLSIAVGQVVWSLMLRRHLKENE